MLKALDKSLEVLVFSLIRHVHCAKTESVLGEK